MEWTQPELVAEACLTIEGGRHPVVERFSEAPFVPNDLRLGADRCMLIITGPNMGGKSTYMRQAALIALLAHIGSYVPADRATLGPLDRIFTRIGRRGRPRRRPFTFMVEMTEAANILHNATPRSLILMDEIGRGTSTFDGLSLAWAIARHIATRLKSFTLFATHYFELTTLATEIDGCANVHLDATEHGDGIVFLHSVKDGPREPQLRTSGRPARGGSPRCDLGRHASISKRWNRSAVVAKGAGGGGRRRSAQKELPLFAAPPPRAEPVAPDEVHTALEALNPDELSPKAALDALYKLRKLLESRRAHGD